MKTQTFSKAAIHRLSLLYRLLEGIKEEDCRSVTSQRLSKLLGFSADSIRKDISFLSPVQSGRDGYDVSDLAACIADAFGFNVRRPACVVGLEGLGAAFIQFPSIVPRGFRLTAGFDSSINRVEIFESDIPLYPAYTIPEIIQINKIEMALLASPAGEAQKQMDRLISGGISCVINYSPVLLRTPKSVFVQNSSVLEEFRILSARMALDEK